MGQDRTRQDKDEPRRTKEEKTAQGKARQGHGDFAEGGVGAASRIASRVPLSSNIDSKVTNYVEAGYKVPKSTQRTFVEVGGGVAWSL